MKSDLKKLKLIGFNGSQLCTVLADHFLLLEEDAFSLLVVIWEQNIDEVGVLKGCEFMEVSGVGSKAIDVADASAFN